MSRVTADMNFCLPHQQLTTAVDDTNLFKKNVRRTKSKAKKKDRD